MVGMNFTAVPIILIVIGSLFTTAICQNWTVSNVPNSLRVIPPLSFIVFGLGLLIGFILGKL